jgi:hypothetical protein
MANSILDGVDDLVDELLGVTDIGSSAPHYQHKTSCLKFSEGKPPGFSCVDLLDQIHKQIITNWKKSERRHDKEPSNTNWQLRRCQDTVENNKSAEVLLERAIIASQAERWWNQVSTSSGLIDHIHDKRRAIDLVSEPRNGHYELIELKVESNTPLHAAIENTTYGLIYVFSRERLTYPAQKLPLLTAKSIALVVLAPAPYYEAYNLSWLESELNNGLTKFQQKLRLNYSLSFRFEAFPSTFSWQPGETTDGELSAALSSRTSAFRRAS